MILLLNWQRRRGSLSRQIGGNYAGINIWPRKRCLRNWFRAMHPMFPVERIPPSRVSCYVIAPSQFAFEEVSQKKMKRIRMLSTFSRSVSKRKWRQNHIWNYKFSYQCGRWQEEGGRGGTGEGTSQKKSFRRIKKKMIWNARSPSSDIGIAITIFYYWLSYFRRGRGSRGRRRRRWWWWRRRRMRRRRRKRKWKVIHSLSGNMKYEIQVLNWNIKWNVLSRDWDARKDDERAN